MAQINIQIEGMSLAEARVVMKALTESVADVEVNPDTAAAVEASKPALDALVEQGRKNAAAEGAADVPTPVQTAVQTDAPKPAPKAAKAAKGKAKSAQPDGNVVDLDAARDAGGMVDKVAKFTKLVDVISVMREEGSYDDDEALIADCERMKDQVPVLKRISDIPGRVKRVLERLSA